MNKQRRKRLDEVYDSLTGLLHEVEFLRDEEQDAFDNMPESLQQGEKGERMDQIISELEEAITNIEEAIAQVDNAKAE